MSTTKFSTPGFLRRANVTLGNPLNPLVTGRLQPGGQIQPETPAPREIVLDRERERSHYFDGKLLKAQDLLRDQDYLDARLRQAGRAFGAGVIQGLDARLADGWIEVAGGAGITPSGLVLELDAGGLRAPVDDAALRRALNQGRHGYLGSGLYLVLLSWHEQPSDAVAEVYPREASVQPRAEPDAYEQGVRLELLALTEMQPVDDELLARARLAERFLAIGADFPGMPADSLALGLLAVRDNVPLWLDTALVRRPRTDEAEPHARELRRARHYADLLDDLTRLRHPAGAFDLARYFERMPAMGPLPTAMVDPRDQGFAGFPDHYQLSLVPVRAQDIDFVRAQAAHLPPLDLTSAKVERVQILVPLADADFERLAEALDAEADADESDDDTATGPRLRAGAGLTRISDLRLARSAFDTLAASRLRLLRPPLIRLPVRGAWETAFATLQRPVGLYYVREFQLAAIQAPQVLPISAGFPEAPEPPSGSGTGTGTGSGTGTGTGTGTGAGEVPAPGIDEVVAARGTRDERALEAIAELRPLMRDQPEMLGRLLGRMDNAYDRFFWQTALVSADPKGFIEGFANALQQGMTPFEAVERLAREFDLADDRVERWKRLADVLGDLQ